MGKKRTPSVQVVADLRKIGAALRRARDSQDESQAALAHRMNISERTLRDAENGHPGVSIGILLELFSAVGQNGLADELIRRVDISIRISESPARINVLRRAAYRRTNF